MLAIVGLSAVLMLNTYHVDELPSLTGQGSSEAYATTTDHSVIVGRSTNAAGIGCAVMWNGLDQQPQVLLEDAKAIGVSDNNVVLLKKDGPTEWLGVFDGINIIELTQGQKLIGHINRNGTVVYSGYDANNKVFSCVWTPSATTALKTGFRAWTISDGDLPGGQINHIAALHFVDHIHFIYLYGCVDSQVRALSSNGRVLLTVAFKAGDYRAYLYDTYNGAVKFDFVSEPQYWPSVPHMNALDINDEETVVGWYGTSLKSLGFIKQTGMPAYDANLLLDQASQSWHIERLFDVNEDGCAVGQAKNAAGQTVAVMLEPQ
ncbi:MAG: hypothetical protein JSS66_07185 [Armatimonadetes bacterium]|nr:hypothetical protein [Armatimonadota bacterium]